METDFFDSEFLCSPAGDSAVDFLFLWIDLSEAVCQRASDGCLG